MRQPCLKKRVLRTDERVRGSLSPTVKSLTKQQAYNHNIYTEDQLQIHGGCGTVPSDPVSPYESCLDDNMDHIFLVFSTHLIPTVLLSPLCIVPYAP